MKGQWASVNIPIQLVKDLLLVLDDKTHIHEDSLGCPGCGAMTHRTPWGTKPFPCPIESLRDLITEEEDKSIVQGDSVGQVHGAYCVDDCDGDACECWCHEGNYEGGEI